MYQTTASNRVDKTLHLLDLVFRVGGLGLAGDIAEKVGEWVNGRSSGTQTLAGFSLKRVVHAEPTG